MSKKIKTSQPINYDLLKNFTVDNTTTQIVNGTYVPVTTNIIPTTTSIATSSNITWTTNADQYYTIDNTSGWILNQPVNSGYSYSVSATYDPDYNLKTFGNEIKDTIKNFRDLPKEKLLENKAVRDDSFQRHLAHDRAYRYMYSFHGVSFVNGLNTTIDEEVSKKMGKMDFDVRAILLDAIVGIDAKVTLSLEEHELLTRPLAMLFLGA